MYHNLRKNGTDEVRIERSRMRNMKVVDTREYVGMLKELTEEGKEVSMLVFGSSMAPFLIHARDMIYFKKPDRELQKGDIVFFRRKSGQFVMHRIWKIRPEGYYIVGDAQTQIEGPVKREQIFALITKVRRKEKWLESNTGLIPLPISVTDYPVEDTTIPAILINKNNYGIKALLSKYFSPEDIAERQKHARTIHSNYRF